MTQLALVCTVHEEIGLVTAPRLHAILERITPNVIFLEVPIAAFGEFYETCERSNLESMAVRMYREHHDVVLVPVDLPTPGRKFFEDHERLERRLQNASHVYRQLLQADRAYQHAYGFEYLNSDYCSKQWADIYKERGALLDSLGDPRLLQISATFSEANSARDTAMVESILSYCHKNPPAQAAFLVGAAHRQGILDTFGERSRATAIHIDPQHPGIREPQSDVSHSA